MKKTVLFFAILVLVSACAQIQSTNKEVKTTPDSNQAALEEVFGDIPVYPGFKLIPEKSFTYQSGDIKVGRMIFAGEGKIPDIINFYIKSLPELGWDAVSTYTYGKSAFMDFISETRSLQIQIEEKSFSGTRLSIQVGPRGGNTAPLPTQEK